MICGKNMRDANYEIIVFSDEWDGMPHSCKHLLRQFLPGVPLIWIETIGVRSPKLNLYDVNRTINKIRQWLSIRKVDGDDLPTELHILRPLQVPYNQLGIVRLLNKQMVISSIRRFYRRRPERDKVLVTIAPHTENLVGCLGERLSIYYRVDEVSELPGVRKNLIVYFEKRLIEKVDIVVATAQKLMPVDIEGKVVKYLPHGVDYEHFSSVRDSLHRRLAIERIPKPRIGFFGVLNSWVDLDLICQVAGDHPAWSFVFIGPSQLPHAVLPKVSNIHFLGRVNYDELPLYAVHFDVGLIPFKVNALTEAVNPLKLLEYFSIGLPVVSTPLPEVIKYRHYTRIASDSKDFGNAIQSVLDQDNEKERDLRRRLAKDQSWRKRSTEFKSWIDEMLKRKITAFD